MCGIAGIYRLTNKPFPLLDDFAAELLNGIDSRGGDACGYVAINDIGDVQLQKASCRAFYFNKHRAKISDDSRTVLMHTRWATQGKPAFPENNHPVETAGIFAVHNGHIWNDDSVFTATGKTRRGEVDSEAIPALVAASGWEKAPGCFSELDGAMAVAMLNVRRPKELILARGNDSPLVYVQTRDLLVFASTSFAIKDAWQAVLGTPPADNKFRYLTEGSGWIYGREKEPLRVFFNVGLKRFKSYSYNWNKWDDDKEDLKPVDSQGFSPKKTPLALNQAVEKSETKARVWDAKTGEVEEVAVDVERCEDCGDYFLADDVGIYYTFGIRSFLCDACLQWAEEAGIQTTLEEGKA